MAVSMLSGCSNGSDNSSTAQNSGEEPTGTITLKIAHNMDFVTIPDAVLAAGERLMQVIRRNEGGTNKDLAKFADQINSLCDKWDR